MNEETNNYRINGTILIVDDNPKNLQVIGSLLNSQGYNIALANSGERALNYLTKKNADLILLDIMMPEMDGYEVIARIKDNYAISHIPVIFLTSKTEIKDVVKGFQSGSVDYVTKPFNKEEILSRIKTHIELKKSRDLIIKQNEKLAESEKNLLELNNTKDKFFSIIAHDLRNPISAFSNLTEMLHKDYNDFSEEEKIELIAIMFDSAKGVSNLLENLLTWSRSQTGTIRYQPVICEIGFIVESTISVLKINAQKKGISLINELPDNVIAFADQDMITTVIRNLTSNAIKFTGHKGVIKITSKIIGEFLEISVSDSGIGISDENLKKLFRIDVHHISYGTDNEKGTGLGLILCKEFVEINGGQIYVNSVVGSGSTFSFTLPLYDNSNNNRTES